MDRKQPVSITQPQRKEEKKKTGSQFDLNKCVRTLRYNQYKMVRVFHL